MTLTEHERAFVLAILKNGEFIAGDGTLPGRSDAERRISAEAIKRVLIGFSFDDEEIDLHQRQFRRFVLKGALIDEPLSLTDLSEPNLPVTFENCFFATAVVAATPSVDMSEARCGRVSFKGSRFVEFRGHSGAFIGSVDFSEVASAEEAGSESGCEIDGQKLPRCEIDLRSAQIGGVFRAAGAKLAVRYRPKDAPVSNAEQALCALKLSGSRIAGEVTLQPDVVAMGGVAFAGAQVEGNIWLGGGELRHVWDEFALNLQQAYVRDALIMRVLLKHGEKPKPFRCKGTIRLYGAEIGGEVYCAGARLEAPERDAESSDEPLALMIYQAKVAQQVRLVNYEEKEINIPFECAGAIMVMDSHVGAFQLFAKNFGDGGAPFSIYLSRSQFDKDVEIGWSNYTRLTVARILANLTQFSGNVHLSNVACDTVDFSGAHIGGDFSFSQATCDAVQFSQSHVERNFTFGDATASQVIDFSASHIGGDFRLESVRLDHRASREFDLSGIKIDGTCTLSKVTTRVTLNADQAQVGRDLVIDRVVLKGHPVQYPLELSLSGAEVRGSLRMMSALEHGRPIYAVVGSQLSASNAKLRSTPLSFYPGWEVVNVQDKETGETISLLWNGQSSRRSRNSVLNIILLDGTSPPIHEFNATRGALTLNSGTVRDYLSYFCAYIWGEDGAFRIITRPDELAEALARGKEKDLPPREELERCLTMPVEPEGDNFKLKAIVAYSNAFFMSDFVVSPNGMVEMTDDQPIAQNLPPRFSFDAPYWQPATTIQWPVAPLLLGRDAEAPALFDGQWSEMTAPYSKLFRDVYEDVIKGKFAVDLEAAKVSVLNDNKGCAVCSNVALHISGFAFEQLDILPIVTPDKQQGGLQKGSAHARANVTFGKSTSTGKSRENPQSQEKQQSQDGHERARQRIKWIERGWVFDDTTRCYRPAQNLDEFDAHPYQQVIDAYGKTGRTADVVDVLYARLKQEWRLWSWYHLRGCYIKESVCEFRNFVKCRDFRKFRNSKAWAFWLVISAIFIVGVGVGVRSWSILTALLCTSALSLLVIAGICIGPTLVRLLFWLCFGYGLKLGRAFLTVLVCVVGVGWPAVEVANRDSLTTWEVPLGFATIPSRTFDIGQALVVNQTPVQTHVAQETGQKSEPATLRKTMSLRRANEFQMDTEEIPCGKQINALVYALDVFLPLVDLHEEDQCRPSGQEWAVAWQWSKTAYALLGWVVMSLFIITATGFIRRLSEK